VSLKQIIVFLIFALLSIYTAFLNPHDSVVHITQNISLKLPTVLLLFGSILIGVVVTVFLFWAFNLKSAWARWKTNFQDNQIRKKNYKAEAIFKKGENLFICGKTDKALALIEKVLETYPEHVGALHLLGQIQDATDKPEQAEISFKKILALEPQNIHVLYDLANFYAKTDRQKEKISLLQKAERMYPGTAGPLLRLRDIYAEQEDWKKVCALQKRVLPLLRDNHAEWKKEQTQLGQFLFELGQKYLSEKKQDSAISEFKQALRTSEQCLPAYLSLGDAYLEAGKQKQALKIWKTGFQKTGHISCLVRSQIALRESKNFQEFLCTYEEALETSKQRALLVLLLSTFYLEHGLKDKARQLLENNPPEHALLHSLLLEKSRHPENSPNTSQFELARDAIFALTL
jgi:lipopolysaccharide assembly protein B